MELTKVENSEKPENKKGTILELIELFLNEQDVRVSSKKTYEGSIKWFLEWMRLKKMDFKDVTLVHLKEYKFELEKRELGTSTISSYLTVVKLFYEWLEAHKLYPNVSKGLKMPKRVKKFQRMPLTPMEVKKLLAYFKSIIELAIEKKKTSAIRNYAIVNLLVRTGLREMECLEANIENISSRGGKRALYIRSKGKSDKQDYVILTDKTFGPIQDYLNLRKNKLGGSPIFASNSNVNLDGRMETSYIRKIVKAGLRSIGLTGKEYSTHSCRHACATAIIDASGSTEKAQWVLRHSNYSTTLLYGAMAKEKGRLESPPEELLDDIF
jgi:integrase/recombinase XerD